MFASISTEPGQPTKPNEDWAGASLRVAVLLDGLSSSAETGSGCIHGTPWYVEQLGSQLLAAASNDTRTLIQALGASIAEVADRHRGSCDLSNPAGPSATVAALRSVPRQRIVEYLVLADARVVLRTRSGTQLITDDRVDSVARSAHDEVLRERIGSAEHHQAIEHLISVQRPLRNQPGGYWVAAANPSVAEYAVAGSVAFDEVQEAALLSDGASRIVDNFDAMTWADALTFMHVNGPQALIRRVRRIESADPDGRQWPRYKKSDDATAVYVSWQDEPTRP